MKKRYFGKQKKEPGLGRIILALAAVMGVLVLASYLYRHGGDVFSRMRSGSGESAAQAVEQARLLLEQGDAAAAAEALRPALRSGDPVTGPKAVILQADIDTAAGKPEEALKRLEAAVATFRSSPEFPALTVRLARELERAGRAEEARTLYESLRDNAPPEMQAFGLCGLGRLTEAGGDLVAARDLFRDAVERAPWDGPAWNEAVEPLGRLNTTLIFSRQETPESRFYTVEKGDNITSIGIKLNTTQGLLLQANGLSENPMLNLGQRLKYTPKDFHIVIERSTCRLFLLDNRGIFKMYRVGLGKPGHETALGKHIIGVKQKDPVWFKPGFGPIQPGDPTNELGTRWMPLIPQEEGLPKDLGIHGTIAPETVGHYSSHGCARMVNAEVEELWDLVVRSTPVAIVEAYTPGMSLEPSDAKEASGAQSGADSPVEGAVAAPAGGE